MFLVFAYLLFTLVISFWNASVVGRYWTEKRELPGNTRLLLWSGAIMATAGFFVVYVLVITMGMYDLGAFPALAQAIFKVQMEPAEVDLMVQSIFDLSYLVIIFPVIGAGFVITANSWAVAYKRRDMISGGIAAYNTGAQLYNTYNAVRHVPKATGSLFSGLGKLFKSKDSGKALAYIVIFLFPIVISLGGAILTTAIIIRASDAKYDLADIEPAL